jgi:hypothetical protein
VARFKLKAAAKAGGYPARTFDKSCSPLLKAGKRSENIKNIAHKVTAQIIICLRTLFISNLKIFI